MSRRTAWLALALVGLLVSGCTFSSGSTTEVTETGQEGSGSTTSGSAGGSADRKPEQPTPSAPHVSALCDRLTEVYLSDIGDAKSADALVTDWVKVTAQAPASLKDDLNVVGAYLVAAAKNDYATLKGASDLVGEALDHVDRYVTKVCRA